MANLKRPTADQIGRKASEIKSIECKIVSSSSNFLFFEKLKKEKKGYFGPKKFQLPSNCFSYVLKMFEELRKN